MEKTRVISILAAYSPPLSSNQIETIAEEIATISQIEVKEAVEKAFTVAQPKRRSR